MAVKVLWENGVVKRTKLGRRMNDLKSDSVDMRQGKSLVVRLSRAEEVQLDGDPFGGMVGCRVVIEPGVLTVDKNTQPDDNTEAEEANTTGSAAGNVEADTASGGAPEE